VHLLGHQVTQVISQFTQSDNGSTGKVMFRRFR
jgi:hypothetical protein